MSTMDTSTLRLGKTAGASDLTHLEGQVRQFPHKSYTDPVAIIDARLLTCQYVKNARGSAITPGLALKYTAGYYGKRVTVCTEGDKCDGVADPYLPAAGAADGEHFMMVMVGTKSPCKIVNSGDGALAQGDVLVTDLAGEVKIQIAAPSDTTAAMVQVNSKVGVCEETIAATAHLAGQAEI